jgi:hypothetical protein
MVLDVGRIMCWMAHKSLLHVLLLSVLAVRLYYATDASVDKGLLYRESLLLFRYAIGSRLSSTDTLAG